MEKYIPENLQKWTLPDSYFGESWDNYFVFFGQHRNSDLLSQSNFQVAISRFELLEKRLEKEGFEFPENSYQIVRESHWAVGWIEWIAISEDAIGHLKLANKLQEKINDYPILNEDHFSELEATEANRVWKDCYSVDERIEYIRENKSQFEFNGYSDLIGCVRGKWFCGYASELLN